MTPMMDMRRYTEKCDATEDMLAAVQAANENLKTEGPGQDISLISMDAEALYPSLNLEDILQGIWDLVLHSDAKLDNVDIK